MDVTVVEADLANPVHARGLVEILDSYARDPMGGARSLPRPVRERLVSELAARANAVVLLGLASGDPIGVAVCFLGFSTFAARPLLNVHDLAVLPEFRGSGVGRALLEAAESRARQLGCCKLTLEVREDNERARSLYERVGFSDFSPGADPAPTLFLEKRLGSRQGSTQEVRGNLTGERRAARRIETRPGFSLIARCFLGFIGLMSVPYGIFCFIQPGFLEQIAGVGATSTTGTVELRAMYGGLQTGFGALALLGALRPAFLSTALLSTLFLCAGLGSFRLMGAIAASEVTSYTAMGLIFELGSTVLAAALLRQVRPAAGR